VGRKGEEERWGAKVRSKGGEERWGGKARRKTVGEVIPWLICGEL